MMKTLLLLGVFCMVLLGTVCFAEPQVCGSWTPAMVGGPVAQGNDLLAVRWIEGPNMELTYNGQIILLSAYFYRGPDFPNMTVDPKEVKKVDAIFLGHGHGDHMLQAAQIAKQTGAKIYAQAITIDLLKKAGEVPAGQLVTVKDGDVINFKGFKVEAVHAYHSGKDKPGDGERQYDQITSPEVAAAFGPFFMAMIKRSAEQEKWEANNPYRVSPAFQASKDMENDAFAYLFTFADDFRFFYHDSSNHAITKQMKDLMAKIKSTDIASIAYAGTPARYAVPWNMPETKLLNPRYVIPNHHHPAYEMDLIPYAVEIRKQIAGASLLPLVPNQVACFNVKNHKLMLEGIILP
jgi:L-ascorbate metabolism protein UlaG (beta-lactamase superfamily)